MKHLNFILAGLFFLCGLCCRAQVLPLEENVVLNTKEGQIKGKMLLPGWGENLSGGAYYSRLRTYGYGW